MSQTENAPYQSPEEVAERAQLDWPGNPVDQNGYRIDGLAQYPVAVHNVAERYVAASPESRANMHVYKSVADAEKAKQEAIEGSRAHVAENLPSYVALALQEKQHYAEAKSAANKKA